MMLFNRLTTAIPTLERVKELDGVEPLYTNPLSQLYSYVWKSPTVSKARLCLLNVPEKFFAETLVIYPLPTTNFPIFGCEYLNIGGKKFFGGIDFHPVTTDPDYAEKHLSHLPDTPHTTSKFYDLNDFFSKKFWMEKRPTGFYEEYLDLVDEYLEAYRECIETPPSPSNSGNYAFRHRDYNTHMAERDPARGILKAYFSEDFAEYYISNFLFSNWMP